MGGCFVVLQICVFQTAESGVVFLSKFYLMINYNYTL